jgi:FAD/FMN-containing dehydrogenase
MHLSGWGRYPVLACNVLQPRTEEHLLSAVAAGPVIARGMGRAYGDSALNSKATIDMRAFSRMLSFDPQQGLLVAEAGVVLSDIIATFLPQGWFPAVTPGTQFVSLGGMVAADVHGKNHHRHGSFGHFIEWLDVIGPQGKTVRCSPSENSELFYGTIGGMGLTGIILRLALRLMPVESAWIRQRALALPNLDAAMAAFADADSATYSVAWIDCLARGPKLGRSVLLQGEHARVTELDAARAIAPFASPQRHRLSVPVELPVPILNRYSVRAFNELYFRKDRAGGRETLVGWDHFFYPLDAINQWNRIYGKQGFAQFQCLIPLATAQKGLTALLKATSENGSGSFLAVLKRFGPQESAFSFPMEGYTLALDFPINAQTLALLECLDQITLDHGGRFYLAKDARMKRATLEASDERVTAFREMRSRTGAALKFMSAQSGRLSI